MKSAFAATAVLSVCIIPALTHAQTAGYPPVGTTPAPVAGAPIPGAPGTGVPHGDRHPEMRRALKQLENAKESLQHATHDYSGHRDQAINLIDQAENQIRQGLEAESR